MRSVSRKLQILAGALLLMMAAGANALTFTIDGDFDDGGEISGTFDWDGSVVTAINLVTTAGSVITEATSYVDAGDVFGNFSDGFLVFTFTVDDAYNLSIAVNPDLSLTPSAVYTINSALSDETSFDFSAQRILSGTVTAVPLPAAAWLFLSALGALGIARRRRAFTA